MPSNVLAPQQDAFVAARPISHSDQVGELYNQHHRWLYVWLCKKLGCSHHAADIAQDTFVRLFSLSGSPTLTQPRGFLATTAKRLIIDEARRKKVERHYLDNYSYYHGGEGFEGTAPSAEELVIITETLVAIVQMLEALPEKCQRAFLMSRLDGMRHAEIAEALGVSKSSVKQYIAKAMLHCYQLAHSDEVSSEASTKTNAEKQHGSNNP
jgi:RNA polymerase sigma-19 factor, ECF subfamily